MQAKNLLLLSWILLITLFSGCSTSQNQLTLHVQNPTSIDRENEMVEVAWKDIRQHLSLSEIRPSSSLIAWENRFLTS